MRWLLVLTGLAFAAPAIAQTPASHGLFDRAQDVAPFSGYGTANPQAGDLRLFGWQSGAADQTAVMRRALDALSGGGEIVIPYSPGCTVLGAITVDASVAIRGEGGPAGQTNICAATASTTVFDVTSPFVTISNLAFKPVAVGKQSAGSYIKVEATAHRFRSRDVTMSDFREGITLAGTMSTAEITGFRGFIYATGGTQSTACIHIQGGLDIRIDQIICNGPGTGNTEVKAGVWIENVGDIILSNFNLVGMGTDLLVAPANGQAVTSLWAMDGYLDTAYRGVEFLATGTGYVARSRLSNVWASSNTTQGIKVSGGVYGLDIDVPHIFGNGSHGLWMQNGQNIRVRGGQIAGNGDNGVYAEISDWSVTDATIGPTGGFGANASYALYTGGGALSNIRFMNNVVTGNGAGAIQFNGSGGTGNIIINNLGASAAMGLFSTGAADSGGTGFRLVRVPN